MSDLIEAVAILVLMISTYKLTVMFIEWRFKDE